MLPSPLFLVSITKNEILYADFEKLCLFRNIIAGYIYPDDQAPRYWMACTVEAIAIVCAIVTTLVFRTILKRENAKMDEKAARAQTGEAAVAEVAVEKFRYIY